MEPTYEVGLFVASPEGVSMVGASTNPELINRVRTQIAAERARELARIAPPVRVVPEPGETEQD